MSTTSPPPQISLQGLIERTDAKLRYARIYIEALNALPQPLGGSDHERAHAESFLFHLIGARDCFWHELAARAGLYPLPVRVTAYPGHLAGRIPEIDAMHLLARDENSWLFAASELRHLGIHDRGNRRAFSMGSKSSMVQLYHPTRHVVIPGNYPDVFSDWLSEMIVTVRRDRLSAQTVAAPVPSTKSAVPSTTAANNPP